MAKFEKQTGSTNKGIYRRFIKRPIDFCLSLFALLILSPVIIVVALMVRVKLGHPVIFKQKRPGMNEKIFTMYKFRTMTDKTDQNGQLLPDSERLPKFGKMLRSTSLDELPELFNILKGDMSIVGPRPLLEQYLPYYTATEKKRHEVRPGLSGLAQVKGRSFIKWEEILTFDLEYVQTVSLINDAKIILMTFIKILRREDVADASAVVQGEDGRLFVAVGDKRLSLHQPLDIERKGKNVE